jgi:hypothetical protein
LTIYPSKGRESKPHPSRFASFSARVNGARAWERQGICIVSKTSGKKETILGNPQTRRADRPIAVIAAMALTYDEQAFTWGGV